MVHGFIFIKKGRVNIFGSIIWVEIGSSWFIMNLNWFGNIIVHHPFIILSAVGVFSGTCLIIPFMLKTMTFPHFQDPQLVSTSNIYNFMLPVDTILSL